MRMGRMLRRGIMVLGAFLLLLLLVGAGAGYWFMTKSLPQTSGTLALPGLTSKVTVIRDANGVPQIYADNADDLFMAQGYVQAQDRLWQMEFDRHVGYGKLAELFGADLVDEDTFLRTIGLGRAAKRDLANTDPLTLRYLKKFADGVNALLRARADNLPIEFTLLGDTPEDWQPLDTLVWGKVMAYDLGGNYDRELLRAALNKEVGAPAMQALLPPYPAQGPFIIPQNVKSFANMTPEGGGRAVKTSQSPAADIGAPNFTKLIALNALFGGMGQGLGSNNWVVDGTKTTTGKPLLANDPHLGIQMPSIWYVNGLHCTTVSASCPFDVVGYTFAGVPGVVIGHNDRIAWGVTNAGPDVQDLYVEKINPANPNQYEYKGKWEDMQLIPEVIKVKGGADVNLTVKVTRHGPLMNGVFEGVTEPLALQWTALREPSRLLRAVLGINAAQNWNDFRNALRDWDGPSQNFVYADVDGNIGYQMPGTIPIRAQGDGTMPVPGWTGEYEWTGSIPFDELPMVYNPSSHFIVTANNQIVPGDYKYLLTRDWQAPFRAARLQELLSGTNALSVDDFKKIQTDTYSTALVKLQQAIRVLPTVNFLTRRALDYVNAWDGRVDKDAQAPAILEATFQALVKDLFGKRMSAETFKMFQQDANAPRQLIDALLNDPQNEWWDDPATPARETRDARLAQAYSEGVDFLGKLYGDAPPEWKWGRIHTATFAHPFGAQKPLDLLFNAGPVPSNGNGFTINNGGYRPNALDYAQRTVSSMRFIADLSNWDAAQWIQTTGQSGQPLSPHYSDLMMKWRDGLYETLPFSQAAVERGANRVLTLTP